MLGVALLGVMSEFEPAATCLCGCPAVDHSPCCGACLVCGNVFCDGFEVGQ